MSKLTYNLIEGNIPMKGCQLPSWRRPHLFEFFIYPAQKGFIKTMMKHKNRQKEPKDETCDGS